MKKSLIGLSFVFFSAWLLGGCSAGEPSYAAQKSKNEAVMEQAKKSPEGLKTRN